MSQLIGGAGGLGWVVAKSVLMFAVTVAGLRLGERRTLAQLGAFDFAVAVAIGSIIGRTVTASDTSFLTGAVALVTLLAVHRLVALARRRSRIASAVDHPPRVLVAQGKIQRRELARAGLTDADVHALLRQQGVDDLGRVGYLLYETRGATTLVGADREPGPLTRDALSSAGFDHVIDKSSMIVEDLCTYTMIILRQDKILRDHVAAAVLRAATWPRLCTRDELDSGRDGAEVSYTLARRQPPGWTGFSRPIDAALLKEIAWGLRLIEPQRGHDHGCNTVLPPRAASRPTDGTPPCGSRRVVPPMRELVPHPNRAARVDPDPADRSGTAAAVLGRHGRADRTAAGQPSGRLRAPPPVESGGSAGSDALVGGGRRPPVLKHGWLPGSARTVRTPAPR